MKTAQATVEGCFEAGPPPPTDTNRRPDHPEHLSHPGNKEAAA